MYHKKVPTSNNEVMDPTVRSSSPQPYEINRAADLEISSERFEFASKVGRKQSNVADKLNDLFNNGEILTMVRF